MRGKRSSTASTAFRGAFCMLGLLCLGLTGCAHEAEPAPGLWPADPFASWVESLETGRTRPEDVRAQFGRPRERAPSPRGGWIWRYTYFAVDWPAHDPRRPVVSAQGKAASPASGSGPVRAIARVFGASLDWLGGVFLYPPRQPRPPRTRPLPATIHSLELHFGVDGILRHVRYQPEEGLAQVPVEG